VTALAVVECLLLLWVSLLYVPFRWRPFGIFLITEKMLALAYAPIILVLSTALAVVGAMSGSWSNAAPAGMAAIAALAVIVRVGSVRTDLSGALGGGWREHIPAERRVRMVSRWWAGPLPTSLEPRWQRDVPFATVPGAGRVLLCDVWQPPIGVASSGVAVVYMHGSGYVLLDKDCGTRRLFRHLAAQGHVVVDVAYRLFPETDVVGMVADAKRAIAWVRGRAGDLGVDPERIVLVGGSAGGHLSLLAAYGHDDPALTPPELAGSDLRVSAVASLYGQVGLDTMYEHTGQDEVCHPDDPRPDWTARPSRALVRLFGDDAARLRLQFMVHGGRSDWLVGGAPREVPDRYARLSALTYVRSDCPPTLLMHGTHDEMAPVGAVRRLERRLEEAGAPVTAVYLPHTDHAFDLVGTAWSPAARVAVHVLERFLAATSVTSARTAPAVATGSTTSGASHALEASGASPLRPHHFNRAPALSAWLERSIARGAMSRSHRDGRHCETVPGL
jgi:acetyl esterase/lipase